MADEATPAAEDAAPDNEAVNPQLVAAAAALVEDQAETDSLEGKKNGELAEFILGKIKGDLDDPAKEEAPAEPAAPEVTAEPEAPAEPPKE